MILLIMLRTITFTLNRLQDSFLLSNCCAVLLNLSPHAINLHENVASRLVSVTTSCMKRYSAMVAENGNNPEAEGDLSSLLGMHGEVNSELNSSGTQKSHQTHFPFQHSFSNVLVIDMPNTSSTYQTFNTAEVLGEEHASSILPFARAERIHQDI